MEFGEFCLRRPVLEDAEAMHLAIRASFADLHLWMPWCVEPVNIEDQRGFIERSVGNWESQTAFAWFITGIALGLPGIERVEIICDAANLRSCAVPRRAGYRLAREEYTEPTAPGECGLEQHWVMP
jgi:hypothetical protein